MMGPLARITGRGRRRGFSLVEVVVSTIVVALLLVAGMQTAGASKSLQYRAATAGRGTLLAQALLSEVLAKPYAELNNLESIGPEPGEGGRAAFDDVDDFHGWSDSPPTWPDGSAMALHGGGGWGRSVTVEWVGPLDLTGAAVAADGGVKRVTVTVARDGLTVATLVGIKTDAP